MHVKTVKNFPFGGGGALKRFFKLMTFFCSCVQKFRGKSHFYTFFPCPLPGSPLPNFNLIFFRRIADTKLLIIFLPLGCSRIMICKGAEMIYEGRISSLWRPLLGDKSDFTSCTILIVCKIAKILSFFLKLIVIFTTFFHLPKLQTTTYDFPNFFFII